ncbi:MAG: FAD-dependent oxidoreductase [Candidatus Bathyarchaeia archaeon]
MSKIIILGGGWTGVSAALEFKARFPSVDILVIESSLYSKRGGLLRSEVVQNHIFDVGGSHIIFSRNSEVLSKILALLGGNLIKNTRKSFILFNGIFVPYPFENGLYMLPTEDRADALISFLEAWMSRSPKWEPKTLKEWIYGFFGKWIAEKYLVPYNEKIWSKPLDQLDADWVYTPGRLPIADWKAIVKSSIGIPTIGYVEQSIFYYPRKGGIQALYDAALEKAMSTGVDFLWSERVTTVKNDGGEWLINDRYRGDLLISTIPLPELVKVTEAPEEVIKAIDSLDYNSVAVVGFALNKPAPDQHWIYVPQKDLVFHRYAWISNYSPYNAPKGQSTLIAEVSIPKGKMPSPRLTEEVLNGLEKIGILEKRNIISAIIWFNKYGYPIYTIGHRNVREIIQNWLKETGIYSLGRWGAWHYWNIDKIYEEVIKLVDKVPLPK